MRMKSSVVVVIIVVATGIVVGSLLKNKLSAQKSAERTPGTAAKIAESGVRRALPRIWANASELFPVPLAERLELPSFT